MLGRGGVLGILLRAQREGKLSSLRPAMEAFQQRAGFRISTDLFAWFLEESGGAGI
ncbi:MULTISPECIES: DUF3368 domain-containing protein [Caldilinea]|uniref:DUF3368 domain-containing protein n=1 Tax=Caldilinea TaxID=233191 RepID=UPI0009FE4ABF